MAHLHCGKSELTILCKTISLLLSHCLFLLCLHISWMLFSYELQVYSFGHLFYCNYPKGFFSPYIQPGVLSASPCSKYRKQYESH